MNWLSVGGLEVVGQAALANLVDMVGSLEEVRDVADLTAFLRPGGP